MKDKTKKRRKCSPKLRTKGGDPLQPNFNAMELVVVGHWEDPKMPEDESGYGAFRCVPLDGGNLTTRDIVACVISQTARRPKFRALLPSVARASAVFVITENALDPKIIESGARGIASAVGTFTEARRLSELLRWILLPTQLTPTAIAEIAANELALAMEEDDKISLHRSLFVVWKSSAGQLSGADELAIGLEIAAAAFMPKEPATYSDGYDDGNEDPDDPTNFGDRWKHK